ncbi:MAG: hypothetical protein AAF214_01345 [Pseudomonadota bacterium]
MTWFQGNTPRHMRLFELIRQQEIALRAARRNDDLRARPNQWDALKTRALTSLNR